MNFDIKNKYFKNIKLAALLNSNDLLISWQYLGSTLCTDIGNRLKYGAEFEPALKYSDTILSNYWDDITKNLYKPNIDDLTTTVTTLNEVMVPLLSEAIESNSKLNYFSSIRTNDFKTYIIIKVPENVATVKLFDEYIDESSLNISNEDILVNFNSQEIKTTKILIIQMSMRSLGDKLQISSFIYNSQKNGLRNRCEQILRNDYLDSTLDVEPNLIKTNTNLIFDPISRVLIGTRPPVSTDNCLLFSSKFNNLYWSSTTEYNKGDIVICNNINENPTKWVSLIDKNIGDNPETSIYWRTLEDSNRKQLLNTTIKLVNLSESGSCQFASTNSDLAIINKNRISSLKIKLQDNFKLSGFYDKNNEYISYNILDNNYIVDLNIDNLEYINGQYIIKYSCAQNVEEDNETKFTIELNGTNLETFITNYLEFYILDNTSNITYKPIISNYVIDNNTALVELTYNGKLPNYSQDILEPFSYYLKNTGKYFYKNYNDSSIYYNLLSQDKYIFTKLLNIFLNQDIFISIDLPTFEIITNDSLVNTVSIGDNYIGFNGEYYYLVLNYCINGSVDVVSFEIMPSFQNNIISLFEYEETISTYTGESILICTCTYIGLCPGIHYTIKLI